MDPFVFTAVLAAAACHAGWNALLKLNVEPGVATALVAIAASILVVPLLPALSPPASAAWPYIVASVIIFVAFYVFWNHYDTPLQAMAGGIHFPNTWVAIKGR